jgi:CRP-like cAMP-binding protein
MTTGELGKRYRDGENIIRQGDTGDCMYVIQEGQAEVVLEKNGREVQLARLDAGDCFGEMAIFQREVRSATVRAVGSVRLLTVDKKTFLRRIQEDPALAFRLVETLSHRVRELNGEVAHLKSA